MAPLSTLGTVDPGGIDLDYQCLANPSNSNSSPELQHTCNSMARVGGPLLVVCHVWCVTWVAGVENLATLSWHLVCSRVCGTLFRIAIKDWCHAGDGLYRVKSISRNRYSRPELYTQQWCPSGPGRLLGWGGISFDMLNGFLLSVELSLQLNQ